MKDFSYFLMKIRYRLSGRNKEVINNYFRKMGMKIGPRCAINTNITSTESYLITLGENVTIAGGVSLVTHDNSISKIIPGTTDLMGEIIIGDNCFIGSGATIMYGVKLAEDIVVASGSVVTHSFDESRIIIGGNPARKIGTYDAFIKRHREKAFNLDAVKPEDFRSEIEKSEKLIVREVYK